MNNIFEKLKDFVGITDHEEEEYEEMNWEELDNTTHVSGDTTNPIAQAEEVTAAPDATASVSRLEEGGHEDDDDKKKRHSSGWFYLASGTVLFSLPIINPLIVIPSAILSYKWNKHLDYEGEEFPWKKENRHKMAMIGNGLGATAFI